MIYRGNCPNRVVITYHKNMYEFHQSLLGVCLNAKNSQAIYKSKLYWLTTWWIVIKFGRLVCSNAANQTAKFKDNPSRTVKRYHAFFSLEIWCQAPWQCCIFDWSPRGALCQWMIMIGCQKPRARRWTSCCVLRTVAYGVVCCVFVNSSPP